jgi:TolB-like protein/tetratricopeptide (TPR) repeat protein/predicted Ser/Thr protein kinase
MNPGDIIGSYRVEKKLGEGGMGVVFLAYDTTLHRQVALKVVEDSAEDASRSSLLREARNAAALNHPHICTVHEVRHEGGTTFIAMEYVEGRSLRERIDERGALPYDETLRYACQVADAVAYAHEHGVVHRDLKAANAMITNDGRVKLVDFGLARRADPLMADATTLVTIVPAGAVAGTPYAMAPEQVRGEAADARSDVWALGVLLFEMLTGTRPFRAPTTAELFSAILTEPPAPWPRGVPVAIRPIVERCLEKDPGRRYQQAGDMLRDLDAHGLAPAWTAWGLRARRRPWIPAAAAMALVAATAVGLNVDWIRDRLAARPSAPSASIRLAVIPFDNLTGDPDQAFFSDGLTEETITELGRLDPQRLSVLARSASARYRDRVTPVEQIGRELNVHYLLDGSARREGSRVRISAALIDVRDGTQRWAESFEQELSSILTLQSDIAGRVAASLTLSLLPDVQQRLASARPVNPEAYEAYLRGLSFQANPSPANLTAALSYFELALQKDPAYAPAYAGVAGVWFARLVTSLSPAREVEARAKAAIDQALELDDTLADAHLRLAQYEAHRWNWAAADRAFQRAIALNPNQANTRSIYADHLAIVRRGDEALLQASKAMELDPVSTQSQTFYARILMFTGHLDEAIARYRETLKASPDQQVAVANIRLALHSAGRLDEALRADQAWAATNQTTGGPDVADALTRGYAEGGYRAAMRRAAEVMAARASTNPRSAFFAAQFYVRAGDNRPALDWLEKVFDSGEAGLPYISCAPTFDGLRGEPRFQTLLRRMNLES